MDAHNVPELSIRQHHDLSKTNKLQESLAQLDLKGLLVLNGIITQRALEVILESEKAASKFKNPLLIPNKVHG